MSLQKRPHLQRWQTKLHVGVLTSLQGSAVGRGRGSQLGCEPESVCVTSTMENNTLYKRTRCICKFKNPTKPPKNTEPQASYLLVFWVIIFLWVSWLKSQTQAVTVRAEPRRAGTFTTRYYSSSLLLTALDGKLFKSHLAQTHSLKWDVHLCITQAGDAASLAQGISALGAAVPPATLPSLWGVPAPWALPDPWMALTQDSWYRACLRWMSQKTVLRRCTGAESRPTDC